MVAGLRKHAVSSIDKDTGEWDGTQKYTLKCEKLLTLFGRLGLTGYHDDFLIIDDPYNEMLKAPHITLLRKSY